jgi:hypothetical protein
MAGNAGWGPSNGKHAVSGTGFGLFGDDLRATFLESVPGLPSPDAATPLTSPTERMRPSTIGYLCIAASSSIGRSRSVRRGSSSATMPRAKFRVCSKNPTQNVDRLVASELFVRRYMSPSSPPRYDRSCRLGLGMEDPRRVSLSKCDAVLIVIGDILATFTGMIRQSDVT